MYIVYYLRSCVLSVSSIKTGSQQNLRSNYERRQIFSTQAIFFNVKRRAPI